MATGWVGQRNKDALMSWFIRWVVVGVAIGFGFAFARWLIELSWLDSLETVALLAYVNRWDIVGFAAIAMSGMPGYWLYRNYEVVHRWWLLVCIGGWFLFLAGALVAAFLDYRGPDGKADLPSWFLWSFMVWFVTLVWVRLGSLNDVEESPEPHPPTSAKKEKAGP